MKKITLLLLVLAAFCVSSSLTFAAFDGRGSIESAVQDLEDLLATGDKKSDRRIEKAIKRLEKCLKDEYWESDSTLTKKGKKVFSEKKKAVHELMKMKKRKRELPDEIADAVDAIVTTARMLGQYSIDVAKDFAGAANCVDESNEDPECKKTRKEISKCEKEMNKAQKELDHAKKNGTPDPKYDKAIDHYKKAWEHAQKALIYEIDDLIPDDTILEETSVIVDAGGGTVELPGQAILSIPPGAVDSAVISLHTVNSPKMDHLTTELGESFTPLDLKKIRIKSSLPLSQPVRLRFFIPELSTLLPENSKPVFLSIVREFGANNEQMDSLVSIGGTICGDNDSICVTIMPQSFLSVNPADPDDPVIQLMIGYQPVFEPKVYRLWQLSNVAPSTDEPLLIPLSTSSSSYSLDG